MPARARYPLFLGHFCHGMAVTINLACGVKGQWLKKARQVASPCLPGEGGVSENGGLPGSCASGLASTIP